MAMRIQFNVGPTRATVPTAATLQPGVAGFPTGLEQVLSQFGKPGVGAQLGIPGIGAQLGILGIGAQFGKPGIGAQFGKQPQVVCLPISQAAWGQPLGAPTWVPTAGGGFAKQYPPGQMGIPYAWHPGYGLVQ